MDHAITVKDLFVVIGSAGILFGLLGVIAWLLSQYRFDH